MYKITDFIGSILQIKLISKYKFRNFKSFTHKILMLKHNFKNFDIQNILKLIKSLLIILCVNGYIFEVR